MDKSDLDKFILLFIFILCVVFGLIGLAILVTHSAIEKYTLDILVGFLSAFGSIFAGVVGVFAVFIAYRGLSTWRKQLRYGKRLNVVWDCMVGLREFQNSYINWYIIFSMHSMSKDSLMSGFHWDADDGLNQALDNLKKYFRHLDAVIVKNEWQWASYGADLEMSIGDLHSKFNEYRENPKEINTYNYELIKINNRITQYIGELDHKLGEIENSTLA